MIKVNIKLVKRSDGDVVASGYYKEFKNIDELIRYCVERSTYQYIVDYELVKGGE